MAKETKHTCFMFRNGVKFQIRVLHKTSSRIRLICANGEISSILQLDARSVLNLTKPAKAVKSRTPDDPIISVCRNKANKNQAVGDNSLHIVFLKI